MMRETNPQNNPENINAQRAFWVAIVYTIVAAASVGLSLYIIHRFPIWQAFVMSVTTLFSLGFDLLAIFLIRRGQLARAVKILYWSGLITISINSLLFVGVSAFLIPMVLIIGFVNVFYLLPNNWRKKYQFGPIIAASLMLLVDLIDPSFRVNLSNASNNFGFVALAFLVVGLIFVALRLTWGGNIRVKLISSFMIVALLSVLIVGVVIYNNYRNQLRADIQQRLLNIIGITALQQDGDLHATIRSQQDRQSEAYQQMQAVNAAILAVEPELEYVYTARQDEEGQIHFILDVGQKEGYEPVEIGVIYEDPSALLAENFATLDHAIVEDDFYTDIYGTFLSAYAPFYRDDGTREGIVGVDIVADRIIAKEREVLTLIVSTTLGALAIVSIIGFVLGNLYTQPIVDLVRTAQQVVDGDLSARAEIRSSDEVGELATVFNSMTSQLQDLIGSLEQQVADRTRALETSTEVSRRLSTILDPQQLVREVVEQLQSAFGYYHVHIYLYDDARKNLVMAGGTGEAGRTMLARGHQIERGRGLVGRAAESDRIVLIPDVSQFEGWLPNPLLPETRAEVAVPIAIGSRVLGVLDVQHNIIDGLSQQDADLIQAIANQVAIALQNARLYEQSRQRAEFEALVNTINLKIQRAASIEDVLQVAARELGQALGDARVRASLQASQVRKDPFNQN